MSRFQSKLAMVLFAAFALSILQTTHASADHPATPPPSNPCGRDETGVEDHCYAARNKLYTGTDPAQEFTGVMGQVGILMDPCVPGTLSAGHFSAAAIWLRGKHIDGFARPWIEFGIMKGNDFLNTDSLTYYAFCGDCPDKMQYFGTPTRDDEFMWFYTPSSTPAQNCWHLFVNGSWIVSYGCGVALMKGASEVKVGGEATHWDIDIGPQEYKRLFVLRGSGVWEVFAPSDTSYIRSRYVHRHFDKYDTRPEGALVDVFSRHFLFDEPSTCDIW